MAEPENIIVLGNNVTVPPEDFLAIYIGGFDDVPVQRAELSEQEFAMLANIITRLRPVPQQDQDQIS